MYSILKAKNVVAIGPLGKRYDSQLTMTGWDCVWPLYRATVESRALFGIRQNWKGIPHSIYLFSPQKLHETAGRVRVQSCCWQDLREPSRLRRIHSHVTLSPLILTAATACWGRQLFLDFSFILFHFSLPLPIQRCFTERIARGRWRLFPFVQCHTIFPS